MAAEVSQVAPWLQNAAALTGIAGTGLSAYGQYKQAQQAQQQYEMAVRAWQEEQNRQKRQDAQAAQQQQINNSLNIGQYATNQANDIEDPYLQYARALGL